MLLATRLRTLLLLGATLLTARAEAQAVNFRLGAGVAAAGGASAAGLLAIEGRLGPMLVIRGEGRAAGPDNIALMSAGLGLGIAARREKQIRPYALATVAAALDLREGDTGTMAGLVVGADFLGRVGPFVEVRYDHLWQDMNPGPYYDLPTDHFALLVGIRIGAF